jgi:hypothetical protein
MRRKKHHNRRGERVFTSTSSESQQPATGSCAECGHPRGAHHGLGAGPCSANPDCKCDHFAEPDRITIRGNLKELGLIAGTVGVLAIGVVAFWALWNTSPAVVKHVTRVSGALAPGLTFLAAFVAAIVTAIGWYVTRGIEREKRKIANEAVRDLVRARLKRILGVIREAVSSKKRYNPDRIKYFLNEIQKIYWNVDTFAAFTRYEHDLLRKALDDCQLDNQTAKRTANDPENWNPGECFRQSLAALEPVFRVVFGDEDLGAQIGALRAEELRKHDVAPPK